MLKVRREISLGSMLQLGGALLGYIIFVVWFGGQMSANQAALQSELKLLKADIVSLSFRLDAHIDKK